MNAITRPDALAVTLTASDGYPLAALMYLPVPDSTLPRHTVLVAGALGVPQRYYAAFCSWLAGQGNTVMSFDLRGIGASLPRGQSLRGVEATMLSWARVDFAGAVDALCARTGQKQINVIGHSLGAQHAGMGNVATQLKIRKIVSVAAGSGYWRDWAKPSRRAAPLMFYSAGPLPTRLFGYFPGKRLGMVGNLPQGVMQQFSRWCRHPQFAWDAEPDLLVPSLQSASYPIRALSFTDDEAMTEACTRKLFAAHPNAPTTIQFINPTQVGVKRIGHLGAFRQELQTALWPLIADSLD